jgi:4-amino-4-deoxy-L-arabinose transferase-like glycosyltransferase
MQISTRKDQLILAGILLLAAGIKLVLVITSSAPFNADEAVVALMARHILQGERPIFFYGQAYMGSLDAFLVAGGFWLFGQQVWVIRLVQSLLFIASVGTTYWLGLRGLGSSKAGLLAAILMAVPNIAVTLYSTVSLGGYGEALLIGNLLLLSALRIANNIRDNPLLSSSNSSGHSQRNLFVLVAVWGFLAGLGFWGLALTLIYAIPSGIYILVMMIKWYGRNRRGWMAGSFLAALIGFVFGSLPVWIFVFRNGLARLIFEYGGGAVAVSQAPYWAQVGSHLASLLLLGGTATLGLRPPWEVRWLALPLIPLVLIFWGFTIVATYRKLRQRATGYGFVWVLLGVMGLLCLAFALTPFGNDPSGRYFLPLAVPMALLAGDALASLRLDKDSWRWAAAGGLAVFNLIGVVQCAMLQPPGLTTQFDLTTVIDHRYDASLIAFLQQHGETRGYSTYWVSYPLAFLSHEEIIFTPRLPYHQDLRYTSRDDRYAPYDQIVASSPRVAYITVRHPSLDALLTGAFRDQGIQWQEKIIGDYHVYYALTRPVSPLQLGLSFATQ